MGIRTIMTVMSPLTLIVLLTACSSNTTSVVSLNSTSNNPSPGSGPVQTTERLDNIGLPDAVFRALSQPPYASVSAGRGVLGTTGSELSFDFNDAIAITDGALYFTPEQSSDTYFWRVFDYDSFSVASENIAVSGNNRGLEILSRDDKFFLPPIRNSRTHLRWDTDYIVLNLGTVTDANGVNLERSLGTFTSSPAPSLLVNRSRTNELVRPVVKDTVLRNRFPPPYDLYSAELYNFNNDDRLLNGTGISIAIFDTGIFDSSEVAPALAGRAFNTSDWFWGNTTPVNDTRPESVVNHGTNMARYLLNFAPAASLYDFPFQSPRHLEEEIGRSLADYGIVRRPERVNASEFFLDEYVQLSSKSRLNISIFSHSGSVPVDNTSVEHLGNAIRDGLVFAKTVGNEELLKNSISEKVCNSEELFIPYMTDLSDAKGAFVALQAAFAADAANADRIDSVRSAAGDAASYSLTLYENGNGATSEAAATFSGMMALMMQANRQAGAGFSPRQLVEILVETATEVPNNNTYFGNGVINMGDALAQVRREEAPTHDLYADVAASPLFLNHGFDLDDNMDGCSRQIP